MTENRTDFPNPGTAKTLQLHQGQRRTYPRIYISGPIMPLDAICKHVTFQKNLLVAAEAYFDLVFRGWNPLCPHFHANHGITEEWYAQYQVVLPLDFDWMTVCDAALFLPGWRESAGAVREYEQGKELDLVLYYDLAHVPTGEEFIGLGHMRIIQQSGRG